MILTDLHQFEAIRPRTDKYLRDHEGTTINICQKTIRLRCDNPNCSVEGGREWYGNLHKWYDEETHECINCKRSGDRNPRGMEGKEPWNKGLTKDDDPRVAEYGRSGGLARSGENNPRYGLFGEDNPLYRRSINAGEDNPMYIDGKCYERDSERRQYQHRRWSQAVLRRDDYTCQCCGERGGRLHAHHLYDFDTYPDKRTDLDNGVCLCEDCHRAFHAWHGTVRDACTPADFEHYVSEVHYANT